MEKIYFTSLHLQQGGIQMMVTQMANALVNKEYDVYILCTYNLGKPSYPIDEKVNISYLTSYRPNRNEFKDALSSFKLLRLFQEGYQSIKILRAKRKVLIKAFKNIDKGIIISTRNEDSVLLSKYGNSKVLKIAQIHHEIAMGDKFTRDIHGRYDNIDYLAVLTEEAKDMIEKNVFKKETKTKCVVLENFINPITFSKTIKREKVIVAVGRLHPDKGYSRLLEIFSEVHRIHPEWRLRIIGDGPIKDSLIRIAKEFNISSSVDFLGFMSNYETRMEMRKSSIYAMTSLREGFGIVIIEAMEAGLPVLSFDGSIGPRSIIQHGENGFIVKDDDISLYVKYLEKLIKDEGLRTQMSVAAIKRSQNYFMDRVIGKWINLFESF